MILFWNYSSSDKWSYYLLVNKESKWHKINPILLSKSLWEFSKKEKYDFIIYKYQIYFQISNYKKRNFLNLNNDDNQLLHPTYSKDSIWLKHVSLSNLLCAYFIRLITNHALIGEYKQRFFSNKSVTYPYSITCQSWRWWTLIIWFFSHFFFFYFYFVNLGLEFNVILHITITKCYMAWLGIIHQSLSHDAIIVTISYNYVI